MSDLYWVVALRRDKSCGRVAKKFGLRAWMINLRTWIFGFTCLVFKTTYIDTENHYGKALFSSRERCFSLRWIRKILAIRRRACVSLRRGISGSYIDDQSLMPRYGSRALGGKGHEGQNLSTFVWVLIHPWRWLAWASVIEKPLSVSPIVGLQSDFLHP